MNSTNLLQSTPITKKADRNDERVRLIEEAVLLIRGEWPAVASGLCESVNRAASPFSPRGELQDAIRCTAEEAVRVVDRLYGSDATLKLRKLAASGELQHAPMGSPASHGHRLRPRSRLPRRISPHTG